MWDSFQDIFLNYGMITYSVYHVKNFLMETATVFCRNKVKQIILNYNILYYDVLLLKIDRR